MRSTKGLGIPKNKRDGIQLYSKAANKGNIFAKHALAKAYFNGDGIRQDRLKA